MLTYAGDTKQVLLLLCTKDIGVFSTYIYVDNVSNPCDRKYIRVTIEVVMDLSSVLQAPGDADTEWFSVLIPDVFIFNDNDFLSVISGQELCSSCFRMLHIVCDYSERSVQV